jgi:PPOX class probable F420-dependent enzyme
MADNDAVAMFAESPVAMLATVRGDGAPHLVPVVFAVHDDVVYTAVDAKRKSTQRLRRLSNIEGNPKVSMLVDHYDDDWTQLWWVRADGVAEVVEAPPAGHPGIQALVQRFPQYRDEPPSRPLLVVTVQRWSGWASTS